MAPKCLSATWPPFSLRIALSSNYLCRSPAMTAVLSSNMAPSDRWGLNNGDMAPLTRVRVNDFSCHFGGCIRQLQGPFVFTSIFYQIEALSVQPRFRNLDRQSQTSLWIRLEPQGQLLTASAFSLSPSGSLSAQSGSNIDLVGEALGPALRTELAVIVDLCLPFFTDLEESIRPFAESVGRGQVFWCRLD